MATYVPMIRMKVNGVELQFMFSSMTNRTSISHSVAAQLGVPLKNLRPLPKDADLNECFYCRCPFQCFDAIYEFKGQKFESKFFSFYQHAFRHTERKRSKALLF